MRAGDDRSHQRVVAGAFVLSLFLHAAVFAVAARLAMPRDQPPDLIHIALVSGGGGGSAGAAGASSAASPAPVAPPPAPASAAAVPVAPSAPVAPPAKPRVPDRRVAPARAAAPQPP